MSTLFQSLKPELQQNKSLLVFGYIRQHCKIIDIAKLCLSFYDEVINWTILNMMKSNKPESKEFCCNGMKFKCTLDADVIYKNKSGYAIVYLNAWLTADIKSIKCYFTMYCKQKDALFQRVVQLQNDKTNNWISEEFWIVIDCKKYTEIYLNHYIDILQIKYNDIKDKKQDDYNKDIAIKKTLQFEWNIDKILLDKFMNAEFGQYFVSDTFDAMNNNWCLRIYPNSYDRLYLLPTLLRLPYNISKIVVKCTVTNDINHDIETKVLTLNHSDTSLHGFISIMDSIKVDKLSQLHQLIITVKFQILEVYEIYGSQRIDTDNWACFNVL